MNRKKNVPSLLFGLLLSFALGIPSAFAAIVVDNSPDTTAVATIITNFSNQFGVEYLGDRFTLANNTTITGGAIFSHISFGAVNDSVRFVILPDAGGVPGAVPVLDVVTTLDAVDNTLATSDDFMNRKHATIPQQLLPAGNYWFYMSGIGVQINQGTGAYDDNSFYRGFDGNPDLEVGTDDGRGDVFFTLEGEAEQTGVTENDGCDVGGGGNDIDTVEADSDGTSIFVHLNLCAAIDDKVIYRIHFDYTDQFDGFGNNNPDTPTNAGCVTTSDDTMMLRGNRETGPGEITTDTNMIWYEVDYDELAKNGVILGSGDQVLIWADSQYKSINDRAPNTQEPCSKPQVIGEVMDLTLQ
jgi:hypothetical protein